MNLPTRSNGRPLQCNGLETRANRFRHCRRKNNEREKGKGVSKKNRSFVLVDGFSVDFDYNFMLWRTHGKRLEVSISFLFRPHINSHQFFSFCTVFDSVVFFTMNKFELFKLKIRHFLFHNSRKKNTHKRMNTSTNKCLDENHGQIWNENTSRNFTSAYVPHSTSAPRSTASFPLGEMILVSIAFLFSSTMHTPTSAEHSRLFVVTFFWRIFSHFFCTFGPSFSFT